MIKKLRKYLRLTISIEYFIQIIQKILGVIQKSKIKIFECITDDKSERSLRQGTSHVKTHTWTDKRVGEVKSIS